MKNLLRFKTQQIKILNNKQCVEVKDRRYTVHPTENILRERKKPKPLRNQYQDINDAKTGRNQELIKFENCELEVESYSRRKFKQEIQQTKTNE